MASTIVFLLTFAVIFLTIGASFGIITGSTPNIQNTMNQITGPWPTITTGNCSFSSDGPTGNCSILDTFFLGGIFALSSFGSFLFRMGASLVLIVQIMGIFSPLVPLAEALAEYHAEIEQAEREEREEKRKKSFVAPVNPRPNKPGGRGSPTNDRPSRSPVGNRPTENHVPKNVPTTLEGALQFDGSEGKGVHETLGVLVNAHVAQAKAILGRTNLVGHEDLVAVADIFHLAKHGIGGKYDEPQPFLSEWALDILEGLPSIGGASRKEFVSAWSNAEKERARAQAEADKNQRRIGS